MPPAFLHTEQKFSFNELKRTFQMAARVLLLLGRNGAKKPNSEISECMFGGKAPAV